MQHISSALTGAIANRLLFRPIPTQASSYPKIITMQSAYRSSCDLNEGSHTLVKGCYLRQRSSSTVDGRSFTRYQQKCKLNLLVLVFSNSNSGLQQLLCRQRTKSLVQGVHQCAPLHRKVTRVTRSHRESPQPHLKAYIGLYIYKNMLR